MDAFIKEEMPKIAEALEQKEQSWCHFISIDPGMVNLGSVVGRYKCDQETKVITMEIDASRMKNEFVMEADGMVVEDIHWSLKRWLYHKNFTKEEKENLLVIIEKQYILAFQNKNPKLWQVVLKLQMIQACLYSIFDTFGLVTVLVPSSTYKKKLGIASKKHNENKKIAIQFTKSIIPPEQHHYLQENDHLCDCINQAFYQIKQSHDETFGDEYKVVLKIVENF